MCAEWQQRAAALSKGTFLKIKKYSILLNLFIIWYKISDQQLLRRWLPLNTHCNENDILVFWTYCSIFLMMKNIKNIQFIAVIAETPMHEQQQLALSFYLLDRRNKKDSWKRAVCQAGLFLNTSSDGQLPFSEGLVLLNWIWFHYVCRLEVV